MSRGLGRLQLRILELVGTDEVSRDHLRDKLWPFLYHEGTSDEMNKCRVTIHRAIKSLVSRGFLVEGTTNGRGSTKVKRGPIIINT